MISQYEGAIIALFWLLNNIITLGFSIFYYRGSVNNKDYEQIPAKIAAIISNEEQAIYGETIDIAEDNINVILTSKSSMVAGKKYMIQLSEGEYQANMEVQVQSIDKMAKGWKYELIITRIDEYDKQEYLQLLCDRNHPLSKIIDVNLFVMIKAIIQDKRKERQELRRQKE